MDRNSFREFLAHLSSYTSFNACMNLGVNTDLLKTLCELNKPISAEDLAVKCRVKERLLIEWLDILTTAKVLLVEEEAKLYYLPQEVKEVLAEKETAMAFVLGECALTFGARQKKFIECFKQDGPRGLSTAETPEIFEALEKDPREVYKDVFEKDILNRIDGLREMLESGVEFIDVGCGAGGLIQVVAEHFPKSRFIGVDSSESLIVNANKEAEAAGLVNCTFEVKSAVNFPDDWSDRFDVVFMKDLFHDLSHPRKGAAEFFRIVKNTGVVVMSDANVKAGTAFSDKYGPVCTASNMYYCIPGGLEDEGGNPIGCVRTRDDAIGEILKDVFSAVNLLRVNDFHILHVCSK